MYNLITVYAEIIYMIETNLYSRNKTNLDRELIDIMLALYY